MTTKYDIASDIVGLLVMQVGETTEFLNGRVLDQNGSIDLDISYYNEDTDTEYQGTLTVDINLELED